MNFIDKIRQDKWIEEMLAEEEISWPVYISGLIQYTIWKAKGEWYCVHVKGGHDFEDHSDLSHAENGIFEMSCRRCGKYVSGSWSG